MSDAAKEKLRGPMSEKLKRRGNGFSFSLRELAGALGDLGTLLPLTVGLIVLNGIGPGCAFTLLGITCITTGVIYRLPIPVQPLKATAMIAIAVGASTGQIRAAAVWMSLLLVALSVTKLADKMSDVFPKAMVHGLQFGLGLMMIRSGGKLVLSFPGSLGATVHGAHAAAQASAGWLFPSAADFSSALVLLVLPQIPLTIGNAIVATRDCALSYFGPDGRHVTGRRLAGTMALANLGAGIFGGIPVCHGAGGLTAHYRLGARTGAAGVMLGILLLGAGLAGASSLRVLSATPAWLLGGLLMYVGVRHGMLAVESLRRPALAVSVLGMGVVSLATGNLLLAFAVGLAIKALLQDAPAWARRRATQRVT
jgi:SulP family sulfate permease